MVFIRLYKILIQSILRISTPYISDEERAKKKYLEGKKKWISERGFNNYVANSRNYVIPTYVTRTPAEPPLQYKFRSIDKKKWIGERNFALL